jgi:gliding motility-associated-like protein
MPFGNFVKKDFPELVRMNRLCWHILLLILISCAGFHGSAQIAITASNPVNQALLNQYVNRVAGAGIDVIPGTASISGNGLQIGQYTISGPPPIVPFSGGIVMSTGQVFKIAAFIGGNNLNDQIVPTGAADPGDQVLNPLSTKGIKDAITLQFSFRSNSSLVVFEYSLGTEEWPDSLSGIAGNDLYGFFISGPDPYGGNYVNRNPASITDGITAGIFEVFSDPSNFIDTRVGTYQSFNGLSKARVCSLRVLPCTDYLLQIKIADTGDEVHDSGIFLNDDGFHTLPDTLLPVSVSLNYTGGDTLMYEGCSPASLVFTKTDPASLAMPVIVRLGYWGSATNGTDNTLLPDSVIIPAGQSSLTLPVSALTDGLSEGNEVLNIRYSPLCGVFDTLKLQIGDNSPLTVMADSVPPICGNQGPAQLNITLNGGVAPLVYSWDNNLGNTLSVSVNPPQTTTYTFTVTDGCGVTQSKQITVNVGTVPTYNTGGFSPVYCQGQDIQIPITQVVPAGSTLKWTGPGTYNSSGPDLYRPNSDASMSGMYILTVKQGLCSARPDTFLIQVDPMPPVPVINSLDNICEGSTLNLQTGAVGNGVYFWSGPLGFSSSLQNPSLPAAAQGMSGTYSVYVVAGVCTSATATSDVLVNPIPQADAGPDFSVLGGEDRQLGVPGAQGVTYMWSPATGLSNPGVPNPIFTPVSGMEGTYTYVLTAIGSGSCQARDTLVITVARLPVASFVIPSGQCLAGNSFQFNANGTFSASAAYSWDFGPFAQPSASTLRNPTGIHFTQTGSYPVRLVVTDNGLSSIPFTANIEVYAMPVSNFTANIFEGCAPVSVSFSNLSESDPLTYLWNFGNQRASMIEEPKIIYQDAGTYSVTLQVTNEWGCRDTYEIKNMIRVYPEPKSEFAIQPFRTTIDNPRFNIQNLSAYQGPCYYSLGNGDTLRAKQGEIAYRDTGTYLVTQVLGAGERCSDTSSIWVRVDPGFKLYIPAAFTPNGDEDNDRFLVFGEDILTFHILIYDRWGELVYESFDMSNGWDGSTRLGSKALPGGIFVYQIQVKDVYGLDHHFTGNVTLLR